MARPAPRRPRPSRDLGVRRLRRRRPDAPRCRSPVLAWIRAEAAGGDDAPVISDGAETDVTVADGAETEVTVAEGVAARPAGRSTRTVVADFVREARPLQWTKNILVFA